MLGKDDLIAAARKLWGPENASLSTETDLRFGTHGSKHVNLNDLDWYDHEELAGGGVLELCRLAGIGNGPEPKPDRWITYPYTDEDGTLLYEVVRKPNHVFLQRRPDGKGGWIWKLGKTRRVLYHLGWLLASDRDQLVFVVEGEKDVESLERLGFIATTNSGGAGKWKPEYSICFKDRIVVILPDNDRPGREHARKVAASIKPLARSVRVLQLPEKDVSDWIARGGTAAALRELVEHPPAPEPPKTNGHHAPAQWTDNAMDGKTAFACNVENAHLGLREDPRLKDLLGYDEMLCMPMLMKPLFHDVEGFKPRPVTDADVSMIQRYLQTLGFKRLGKDTMHQAVDERALENSYHPVRRYLQGLSWDGHGRLGTWMADCLGAPQSEYTEEIGKLFLIAMVARVMRPGCKADYMVILEGPQGARKSQACEVLAGEWFDDHMPDISGKDASVHLRGKWLIEWAEMRAYSKADADATKAFLTRTTERFRPHWGRKEVIEPRQVIFIGSTNKAQYLTDETGGRRFWPIPTGDIDLTRLSGIRDQLFAEAKSLFDAGVPWWPDREFERSVIETEQKARYETDEWQEPIEDYLDMLVVKQVTILQVAKAALGFTEKLDRFGTREQRRIAAILTVLGWTRGRRSHGGVRNWICASPN